MSIRVAYPKDNPKAGLSISALAIGEDVLPKTLKRSSYGNGQSNGNGKHYEYVLSHARVFVKCEEATTAMGIDTRDGNCNLPDG